MLCVSRARTLPISLSPFVSYSRLPLFELPFFLSTRELTDDRFDMMLSCASCFKSWFSLMATCAFDAFSSDFARSCVATVGMSLFILAGRVAPSWWFEGRVIYCFYRSLRTVLLPLRSEVVLSLLWIALEYFDIIRFLFDFIFFLSRQARGSLRGLPVASS